MEKKKKKVSEYINLLEHNIDGKSVNEVCAYLKEKENKLLEKYSDCDDKQVTVNMSIVDYWGDPDFDLGLSFSGTRLETDQEFELRKARSERARKAAAKRKRKLDIEKNNYELELYKKLKEKFEG